MIHNAQAEEGEENILPSIPKIKDGPALLQKPSIRFALLLSKLPAWAACEMACAPTGYPPKIPMRKIDSVPSGNRRTRPKGRSIEIFFPESRFVSKTDKKKKGISDGITVLIHNSKPSRAPIRALCESTISAKTQKQRTITANGQSPQKNLCAVMQKQHRPVIRLTDWRCCHEAAKT